MKEIVIKIKLGQKNFAFSLNKNYKDSPTDLLTIAGVLDIIKKSQLDRIGELEREESDGDEDE